MDKLTLVVLAAQQPKRAVRYGPGGVVEHAVCALIHLENEHSGIQSIKDANLEKIILAPPDSGWARCFECNRADLEFE